MSRGFAMIISRIFVRYKRVLSALVFVVLTLDHIDHSGILNSELSYFFLGFVSYFVFTISYRHADLDLYLKGVS